MSWIAYSFGSMTIVTVVVLDRDCESMMVNVSVLEPGTPMTVVVYENTPLPVLVSDCVADPPIVVRSATTVIPVLIGFCPGVTVTVSRLIPPECTEPGSAVATPVGRVAAAQV